MRNIIFSLTAAPPVVATRHKLIESRVTRARVSCSSSIRAVVWHADRVTEAFRRGRPIKSASGAQAGAARFTQQHWWMMLYLQWWLRFIVHARGNWALLLNVPRVLLRSASDGLVLQHGALLLRLCVGSPAHVVHSVLRWRVRSASLRLSSPVGAAASF